MNTLSSHSLLNATRVLIDQLELQTVGKLDLRNEQNKLEEIQNQIDQTDQPDLIQEKTIIAIELLSQTIIPAIPKRNTTESVAKVLKNYKKLQELYEGQLPKHVQDLRQSPVKLKGSSNSQNHLLDQYALSKNICEFTLEPSKFFRTLHQLKALSEPSVASIISGLKFPEEELCLEVISTSLSDYEFKVLLPEDPLFSKINLLISQLTNIKPPSAIITLIENIIEIYKDYREKICNSKGAERSSLLAGKARLYIKEECYLLEQENARKMACLNPYGYIVRENSFGAGAVARLNDVFFKSRFGLNPINPGGEFAVHALYELISCKRGLSSTQLIKIQNMWVQKPPFDNPEISKRLSELTNQMIKHQENRYLPEGVIVEKVFKTNPQFEKECPFVRKRVTKLVNASSAIEGITLKELFDLKKPFSIDPENFTSMCVLGLLTLASDGRSDNFIASPYKDTYKIIGIDNDHAFEPVLTAHSYWLNLKYTPFLLPEMDIPLQKDFVRNFLKQDPADMYLSLLSILIKKEEKDAELLSKGVFSEQDYAEVCLPLKLPPEGFISLYQRMEKIYDHIKRNPNSTHRELVKALFPAVEQIYRSLSKAANGDLLEAEHLLFSHEHPVRLEDWVDDPELLTPKALEPLCWNPESKRLNVVLETCLVDILPLLNKKNQSKWIEKIFLHFPKHENLVLKNCILKDEQLLYLLRNRSELKVLTLQDCPYVTERSLIPLLEEHRSLHLVIGSCPNLSQQALIDIYALCQKKHHKISFLVNNQNLILEPLLFQQHLASCLEHGRLDFAEICIHLGAKVDFIENGTTLLHRFAEKNRPEALTFLLTKGLNSNQPNRFKQTPLHLAAQSGQKDNVEILLKHKVEINVQDLSKRTPIFLAALRGHLPTLRLLLNQQADILICAEENESILHAAAAHGHLHILKQLLPLPQTQQLINAKDGDGKTALHRAVFGNSDFKIVELLIQNGFDPNAENNYQYTPLHFAAKQGHRESAKILITKGAEKFRYNANNETPFDLAIRFGRDDVAFLLLDPDKHLTKISNPLPKDLESHYYKCLRQANQENNWMEQVFYLSKISDIYLERKNYFHAAKLVNSALAIVEGKDYPAFRKYLLAYLERIEGLFLLNSTQKKTPSEFRGYIEKHRNNLQQARHEGSARIDKEMHITISKYTKDLKDLFATIIDEALFLLDKPPCDYSILALGDMARDEMSLNSGFDFMILIAQEEQGNKKYFNTLSQLIELKMINMGETELYKLPTQPPQGFYLHQISESLVETPQKMAALQASTRSLYAPYLQTTSLVRGSQKLFDTYHKDIKKIISENSQRTCLASRLLAEHIKKFVIQFAEAKGGDLYGPLQGIIEALALHFKIEGNNAFSRIEGLKRKEIFSKKGAENLIEIMQTALKFKFSQMPLENFPAFYNVFLPFFGCVEQFYLTKLPKAFKNNPFYQEDSTLSGKELETLESCLKGFNQCKEKYTENHPSVGAYCNIIAKIYTGLGDYTDAIEWYQKELTISQSLLGSNDPDISQIYEKISLCYSSLKAHKDAIEYCQKNLEYKVKLYGKNQLGLEKIYYAIGMHYYELKKYNSALEQILKAIHHKLQSHDPYHPDLRPLYEKSIELHCKVNDYKNALDMCQKAWNIDIQEGLKDSSDLLRLAVRHIQISQLNQNLHYFEKGFEHASKAFFILADFPDRKQVDIEAALLEICNSAEKMKEANLDKIWNQVVTLLDRGHPLVIRLSQHPFLAQKQIPASTNESCSTQSAFLSHARPSEFIARAGKTYSIQKTVEGSASGLHAALGKLTSSGFSWTNKPYEARTQFAKDLKEIFEKNTLNHQPLSSEQLQKIETCYNKVLTTLASENNALSEFNLNYNIFISLLSEQQQALINEYEESKEPIEQRKTQLMDTLGSQDAYLAAIQQESYCFTDLEMALIAHTYNINLEIYHQASGGSQVSLHPGAIDVGSNETRVLFLEQDKSGNHYWRCQEQDKKEKK